MKSNSLKKEFPKVGGIISPAAILSACSPEHACDEVAHSQWMRTRFQITVVSYFTTNLAAVTHAVLVTLSDQNLCILCNQRESI